MPLPKVIKKPKQERSRLTREAIIRATLDILEETGIEKISTNMIASKAGINISSLYKYFTDKYEILNELALAFSQKQADLICNYLSDTPIDTPLDKVCHEMVDTIVDGTKNDRALVQLQRALIIYPNLHASYQGTNIEIGEAMKPFLKAWNIHLSKKELATAMLCMGEMFGALQDLALSRSSTYDRDVINELKRLVTFYYQGRIESSL
tara:strand:- start:918 stop:1541 length:624 start_codon:yes stop_codon:yes gene_type:complete